MMQRQCLHLLRHGGEKGAAVLAHDITLRFQAFQILPDRGL